MPCFLKSEGRTSGSGGLAEILLARQAGFVVAPRGASLNRDLVGGIPQQGPPGEGVPTQALRRPLPSVAAVATTKFPADMISAPQLKIGWNSFYLMREEALQHLRCSATGCRWLWGLISCEL